MKKANLLEVEYNIAVDPQHMVEDFNFMIQFLCAQVPKMTYIYSNTSAKDLSAFHYDVVELNKRFIPVPVLAQILTLSLSETEDIHCDPEERVMIFVKELREWNFSVNITNIIPKKVFLENR